MTQAPVIAIDGPTASGKGTVAARVARALGFHYLDSGALYRIVALRALETGTALTDADALARLAASLRPQFTGERVWLDGRDVAAAIRTEDVGVAASRIAVHVSLRQALLELQWSFRQMPGLVADGRDMGTVVFPTARLKVFLTASVEARAQRRYKQLIEKGFAATLATLLQDLKSRDERDSKRAAAPLKPAEDAYQLDSSDLSIDEVVAMILHWYAAVPADASA
jgi:cytidylate kinase